MGKATSRRDLMYYQIISNYETQAKVVGHVFKKCGVYFNDIQDENNHFIYTFNHWFEDFYRPYINGLNEINLDEPTQNELRSFILTNNWENKASCKTSDMLVSKYIGQYMKPSTLVVLDYSLEDLNDDLINEMSLEDYEKSEALKQSFIDNCPEWNVVRIDYKKFTNEKSYFQQVMQSLNLTSNVDIETVYPHYYMLELLAFDSHKIQ